MSHGWFPPQISLEHYNHLLIICTLPHSHVCNTENLHKNLKIQMNIVPWVTAIIKFRACQRNL